MAVLWALPVTAVIGELAAVSAAGAGYYDWVKQHRGSFESALVAWTSLAMSFFDMAIYPAMFVTYASKLAPSLSGTDFGSAGWLAAVGVIAGGGACCLLGIRKIGAASLPIGIALLAPFAIMAVGAVGAPMVTHQPSVTSWGAAGLLILWNFMGWETASTAAREARDPQRDYPRAVAVALMVTLGCYASAIFASSRAPLEALGPGGWVELGRALGGRALASAVAACGCMCGVWMFCTLVSTSAQIPSAMARDGLLPAVFGAKTKSGVPYVSIIASCVAYAVNVTIGAKRLMQVDVMLYGAIFAMQALALRTARRRGSAGSFRVPFGQLGLVAATLSPIIILCGAVWLARAELGVWTLTSAELAAALLCACCVGASLSARAQNGARK